MRAYKAMNAKACFRQGSDLPSSASRTPGKEWWAEGLCVSAFWVSGLQRLASEGLRAMGLEGFRA